MNRFVADKLMNPTIWRNKLLHGIICWLLMIGEAILATHGLAAERCARNSRS
jgi:hypothetical protein